MTKLDLMILFFVPALVLFNVGWVALWSEIGYDGWSNETDKWVVIVVVSFIYIAYVLTYCYRSI